MLKKNMLNYAIILMVAAASTAAAPVDISRDSAIFIYQAYSSEDKLPRNALIRHLRGGSSSAGDRIGQAEKYMEAVKSTGDFVVTARISTYEYDHKLHKLAFRIGQNGSLAQYIYAEPVGTINVHAKGHDGRFVIKTRGQDIKDLTFSKIRGLVNGAALNASSKFGSSEDLLGEHDATERFITFQPVELELYTSTGRLILKYAIP